MGVRKQSPIKWEARLLQYLREKGNERLRGTENARLECVLIEANGDYLVVVTLLKDFPETGMKLD